MSRAIVTFEPQGLTVEVETGTLLSDAAHEAGARLDTPCGGSGVCGGCGVYVTGEVSPPTSDERAAIPPERLARGLRLGCRARALGDVTVRPLSAGAPGPRLQVVETAEVLGFPVDAEGLDPFEEGLVRPLGAAIDVGTTTLVVSLVDLRNGDELGVASAANPQAEWGADVISRVGAAMVRGVGGLQWAVGSELEKLLADLLEDEGSVAGDLTRIAIAGNTAMLHLLRGIDPSPLAAAPYEGATVAAARVAARDVGLVAFGDTPVDVLPGVSAFVGADAVADVLVTRLDAREAPALLVDLGTNGEIALAGPDGLLATSAAAGPAFEGGAIESGMRAESGAIEAVRLGEDIELRTIDDAPVRGLCGSGLIDLVAVLLEAGVISPDGRISDTVPGPVGARVREHEDQRVFVVDEAAGVLLTQKDVRAVQLAKAAVRTGVDLLLAAAGLEPGDVVEVMVAGGFGYHVRPASVVALGLLPAEWEERISFVGNTALAGARAVLVSSEARKHAEDIARAVRVVDLATTPGFNSHFLEASAFTRGL